MQTCLCCCCCFWMCVSRTPEKKWDNTICGWKFVDSDSTELSRRSENLFLFTFDFSLLGWKGSWEEVRFQMLHQEFC